MEATKKTKATEASGGKRVIRQHDYAERLQVIRLYERGLSSMAISREMGLDDSMIRMWVRKYKGGGAEALRPYWRGKPERQIARPRPRMEGDERFQAALRDYASGMDTEAAIARRHGLDYLSFRYHVRRYHAPLVEQRKRRKEELKTTRT